MEIYIDGGASKTKLYFKKYNNELVHIKDYDGIHALLNYSKAIYILKEINLDLKKINYNISKINVGLPGIEELDVIDEFHELFKWSNSKIFFSSDIKLLSKMYNLTSDYTLVSIGTGTSIIVSDENGNTKTYSGWGFLLGDEGSGFDFGKCWIQKTILDFENNITNSNFTNLISLFFKIDDINQIKKMYDNIYVLKENITDFSMWFLTNYKNQFITEKEYIFNQITNNFFNYFNNINLNKKNIIFLSGGMFKDNIYKKIFLQKINKKNKIKFL